MPKYGVLQTMNILRNFLEIKFSWTLVGASHHLEKSNSNLIANANSINPS